MDFLKDMELPEEVKTQLTEQLEKYAEEKVSQEVSGLKAKNEELIAEKKRANQEKEEAYAKAKSEEERIAQENGQFKELYEAQKQETSQLRQTIEQMNASVKEQKLQSQASKIASQMTKDTARAKLLEKEIAQRLTVVDDEIKVLDESGQLTVSTIDDLSGTIRQSYPFLVYGSQAQGGGAARSQGGAEVSAKEMNRSDWEALDHREKHEFFNKGGKLVND